MRRWVSKRSSAKGTLLAWQLVQARDGLPGNAPYQALRYDEP
jgi:hypothetical protein